MVQPIFVILEDYDDSYEIDEEDGYVNDLSGDNFMAYISRQYEEFLYIDNEVDRVKITEDDILEVMFVKDKKSNTNEEFANITIKKVSSKGADIYNTFIDGKIIVTNYYTYDEIMNLIQPN